MFRLFRHFFRKSAPTAPASTSSLLLDNYPRPSVPTPHELLNQLKHSAWTCASINAAVCASHPARLFVQPTPTQSPTRLPTRSLPPNSRPFLSPKLQIANCQL